MHKKHKRNGIALDKLKTLSPWETHVKLKISYVQLADDCPRDTLLDISCFFIGMNKNYVMHLLDGCGFSPVIGMSLLTVGDKKQADDAWFGSRHGQRNRTCKIFTSMEGLVDCGVMKCKTPTEEPIGNICYQLYYMHVGNEREVYVYPTSNKFYASHVVHTSNSWLFFMCIYDIFLHANNPLLTLPLSFYFLLTGNGGN